MGSEMRRVRALEIHRRDVFVRLADYTWNSQAQRDKLHKRRDRLRRLSSADRVHAHGNTKILHFEFGSGLFNLIKIR